MQRIARVSFLLLILVVFQPITPINLRPTAASPAALSPFQLPPGFQDETYIGGLLGPRAFVFAPDGRVFISERGSATSNDINFASIRVWKPNEGLLPTRAITFNTCGDSERGFLGIALDPDFSNNGYIYVYYTRQAASGSACGYNTYLNGVPGPRNRISRVTMVGDTINPATEKILVDNIVTEIGYHNAGDLHFGTDGYLYASTGDGGLPNFSPDTSKLNGKILRIKPDNSDSRGYITTGNPFENAPNARDCGPLNAPEGTDPCREVYAYGLRNPYRFTVRPATGVLYVGDVGGGVWEEVDEIQAGANYGYPTREGPCPGGVSTAQGCNPNAAPPAGMTNPIYYYEHVVQNANLDSAVIGGAFYTGTTYPVQYWNNYFFVDFVQGWIRWLAYNPSTSKWVQQTPDFGTGQAGVIGLQAGPDTNLYYLVFTSDTETTSEIRRIVYTQGNLKPSAQISGTPPNSPSLSTVYTFSGAGSTDPDNNIPLKYNWDFGDGTIITGQLSQTIQHTYASAGAKTVTLTVTDSGNPPKTSDPATMQVFPGNVAPSGDIVLTNLIDSNRTNYHAGDDWQFVATNLTDDQALPPNAVNWEIVFHHSTHNHPFLPNISGNSGQFNIPNFGEPDPQVWYRVHLRITDSAGQTVIKDKDILPVTAQITLQTNVTGTQIVLAGAYFPSPKTVTRVVGMEVPVDVPSPQTVSGVLYYFDKWSNGGTQAQTIYMPATDTTYTATLVSANIPPKLNYFTTHTPILTWNRLAWAAGYEVQVSRNATFTDLVAVGPPVSSATLALTTPCLDNGDYYWRIRGTRPLGFIPGPWSAAQTFTVNAAGTC